MGLDSVEILMEVENAFGIEISTIKATQILTIGDFQNVVWEYVKERETTNCKSQCLFYKLRQSVSDKFLISKKNIIPDTKLNDIIPFENRRKLWTELSKNNELKFPSLILNKTYSRVLTAIGFLTILGSLIISIIVCLQIKVHHFGS